MRKKMNWKEKLRNLEKEHQWDHAIEFMQNVIKENPDSMDAYICMNYLLMNLLGEEDYDESKLNYYSKLTKRYFDESYKKFSDNPEYLYITGKTGVMGPWFFGIDITDCEEMIAKANQLDPDNLVYKENYYWDLRTKEPTNPKLIKYCTIILSADSIVEKQLKDKGAVGKYLLSLKKHWCVRVLENIERSAAIS
jgi:hypothetical protein